MRRSPLAGLVLFLVVPAVLGAQEPVPADSTEVTTAVAVAKSPARAQFLSIAHSAAPTAAGLALMSRGTESDLYGVPGYWLFAYGVLGGASRGSVYAGDRRRATTGLAIRSAGAALVATSAWRHILSGGFDLDAERAGGFPWDVLSVTGAGIIVGGAAYNIATAPASAAEYNRAAALAAPRMTVSPTRSPTGGGIGVHLDLQF